MTAATIPERKSPTRVVLDQVLGCTACGRRETCNQPAPFQTHGKDQRVAIIGESPNEDNGRVLSGAAGLMLKDCVETASMEVLGEPLAYSILNIAACYGPKEPTAKEVAACAINRTSQLKLIQPEFVLLLGLKAAQAIMPAFTSLEHARRRPWEQDGIIYCVSHHPEPAMRVEDLAVAFELDLLFFMQLIANGREEYISSIPDTCSNCEAWATWWGHNGLGWCEIHLPPAEREKHDAWMGLVVADHEAAKGRLGKRVGPDVAYGDAAAAQAAREAGIAAADAGASPEWKEKAYEAILYCAGAYPDFTADEVWAYLEMEQVEVTHEPAALGPVFLRAAREGLIVNTKQQRPTVLSRRHRDLTVWKSLVDT